MNRIDITHDADGSFGTRLMHEYVLEEPVQFNEDLDPMWAAPVPSAFRYIQSVRDGLWYVELLSDTGQIYRLRRKDESSGYASDGNGDERGRAEDHAVGPSF